MPVLIVLSILLLGRSFYILYVRRCGTRASEVITWLAAIFVTSYWTWRFVFPPPPGEDVLVYWFSYLVGCARS
jgi:hypothetical protein